MSDRFTFGGPHAWTGNPAAEREFRVFGHNGGGGLVAFWLVHLLAGGIGPYEAITFGPSYWDADPQPAIARIAEEHLGRRGARTPQEIIDDADNEYSDLMDRVDALSGY